MELASSGQPITGFQTKGRAWNPERFDIVELLERARHDHIAPIYYGSNHCFLVTLDGGAAGKSLSIYKPAQGEYPLYDFPSGTLYRREVATWLVDSLLGWNLVPPTVVTHGRFGIGSLQLFIESYPQGQLQIHELQRLCLLDAAVNNADRKSDHCLLGENGKLWGIDHGLTFHVHSKLRTVLWHFSGTSIPESEKKDLERLLTLARECKLPEAQRLRELLATGEWRALCERLERLVQSGRFPDPRYKAVPYRW